MPVIRERTTDEWIDVLRAAGVPSGRIQSVAEVCEHPQTAARDMVVDLDHPMAGSIRLTGVPIKLSETPGSVESPPPVLGEHTNQVLSDWLDMPAPEVEALRRDGVV